MNNELRAKFFNYFCRSKDFEVFMKSDFMQPKPEDVESDSDVSPDNE